MREFFYDYDDSLPRKKEDLMAQYGGSFDLEKLPMLEKDMDYIAYDMNEGYPEFSSDFTPQNDREI